MPRMLRSEFTLVAELVFARLGTEGLQPFLDGAKEVGVAAEMADARTKGFQGATEALSGNQD